MNKEEKEPLIVISADVGSALSAEMTLRLNQTGMNYIVVPPEENASAPEISLDYDLDKFITNYDFLQHHKGSTFLPESKSKVKKEKARAKAARKARRKNRA